MKRSNARRKTRPVPAAASLPADRAFVVHFAVQAGPAQPSFAGRVEHLSSGESGTFASRRGLLAFLERPFGARPQDDAATGRPQPRPLRQAQKEIES